MGSPARDIASLLDSSDIDLGTFETDLFVGGMPPNPYDIIACYDTGGWEPAPNYSLERPTVQITVRNRSNELGYSKAQEVFDALNGLCGEVVDGYKYVAIWIQNGPNCIGKDENNNWLFTLNLRIYRSKTA